MTGREGQPTPPTNPPTDRQIRYLAALGYSGPVPLNRRHASQLIDQALKANPPRTTVKKYGRKRSHNTKVRFVTGRRKR